MLIRRPGLAEAPVQLVHRRRRRERRHRRKADRENITAPRRRVEELVAERTEPRDRSEAEIAGYRAVLGTIHASAPDILFSPNVVRQLHRDLYQYAAQPGGDWKGSDNLERRRVLQRERLLAAAPDVDLAPAGG